jgi:hypothetical protein
MVLTIKKTTLPLLLSIVFPEEVDVAINGILPVAYETKGLVMQPIAQCLNDGKPYKEGAGTFKLLPNGKNNNGTNDTKQPKGGAGNALVAGTQTAVIAGVTTFFLAGISGI